MGRGKRQVYVAREIPLADVRAPKRVPTWDFGPKSRLSSTELGDAASVEALCRFRALVGQGMSFHEAQGQAARECGRDPAERGRLGQGLQDLLDAAAAESYGDTPEVEGASDLEWNEIAELAQELIDGLEDAVVSCSQCQGFCSADLAHYLPGDPPFIVGDVCCWDERLRQ